MTLIISKKTSKDFKMLLASNPFFDSFTQSDLMGKGIYISIFALSVISWSLILYKALIMRKAQMGCTKFASLVKKQKQNPLHLEFSQEPKLHNPLLNTFSVLKKQTLEILNKNRHFSKVEGRPVYLSHADIDFIGAYVSSSISEQIQSLEKNVYILSTIYVLAPFLGLLGTVWGILLTFSELQNGATGSANQEMLGGLSLALSTTVLGLLVAIPALIGYHYLKSTIKDFRLKMESFLNEIMATVELQYRQVDIKHE